MGMGLGMNKKRGAWIWHTLHLVAAIALPVLFLLITSCIKAKEEPAQLGPEVQSSDINGAFAKATQGAPSVDQLQNGQYLYYEENRRLEREETTFLVGTHRITVERTHDDAAKTSTIILHHQEQVRKGDSFEELDHEDPPIVIPDGETTQAVGSLARALAEAPLKLDLQTQDDATRTGKPLKITYHNLKVWSGQEDVPDDTKAKADCGGLSPCQMNVTYLTYDEAEWYSETDFDKYHYEFVFTTQLPFMGGLYGILDRGCVGLYVPINGTNYYVRDCQNLTDFKK